jgi:hypothetical protein
MVDDYMNRNTHPIIWDPVVNVNTSLSAKALRARLTRRARKEASHPPSARILDLEPFLLVLRLRGSSALCVGSES